MIGLLLGRRLVLLVPDFGLLLDGCGLGSGHVGGQDWGQGFAALVAAGAGQDGPEIGLIQAGGDATAAPVRALPTWTGRGRNFVRPL